MHGAPFGTPNFRNPALSFLELPGLEETATALLALAHRLALLLHNLADLHRRVEELGGAAVEADGLALVELAFAVVGGDALGLAGLLESASFVSSVCHLPSKIIPNYANVRFWGNVPVVGIGHHAHLALDGSNLLLRGRLRATHSEERHLGGSFMGGE